MHHSSVMDLVCEVRSRAAKKLIIKTAARQHSRMMDRLEF
jgi:hypothetical protein